MQIPDRRHLIACALLFWIAALGRYSSPQSLPHGLAHGLRDRLLNLRIAAAHGSWDVTGKDTAESEGTTVRIATLSGRAGARIDALRLGAQARLNGRIVHELAPSLREDGVLELLLPKGERGLLEISIAALNSAACVTAAASDLRWLSDDAPLDVMALVLRLTPLSTPLCN